MKTTLHDVRDLLDGLSYIINNGCGNHGCLINPPKGMGTNAVCHCTPRNVANALLDLAIEVEAMGTKWNRDEPPLMPLK